MRKLGIQTHGVSQDRLEDALAIFREHSDHLVAKATLQALVGTTSRSFDRIIKSLTEGGAVFEREKDGGKTSISMRLTKEPLWSDGVSPEGLLALGAAVLATEQAGMVSWADYLGALKTKLTHGLSPKEKRLLAILEGRLTVQGGSNDPIGTGPGVLPEIVLALGNETGPMELSLVYRSAGKVQKQRARTVVPHSICNDVLAGGSFLLAFDKTIRQKPILFRLNRIISAKRTNLPGFIPDPDGIERIRRTQIGGWAEDVAPFEVLVQVTSPGWATALYEAPPNLPDAWVTLDEDGTAMLGFKATAFEGAARWLMQLGSGCTVLGPEPFRKRFAKELWEATSNYPAPPQEAL